MAQILFFYCVFAFVICVIFRKFCQDPSLQRQVEEAEDEEFGEVERSSDVPPTNAASKTVEAVEIITPGNPNKQDAKGKGGKKWWAVYSKLF